MKYASIIKGFTFSAVLALSLTSVSFANEGMDTTTESSGTTYHLGFGPGIMLVNSNTFFGGGIFFNIAPTPNFDFGFETGWHRYSGSVSGGGLSSDLSLTSYPVLVGATYSFMPRGSSIRPYMGLSAGLAFLTASGTGRFSDISVSADATDVAFNVLARPGLGFAASETFEIIVEPRIGMYKDMFQFNGLVGFVFGF